MTVLPLCCECVALAVWGRFFAAIRAILNLVVKLIKIPLDKQSRVVLIYTSLRKRFTPPSEARNAEESEIQPDIKGLIFIASAPSQLNRDD